MNFTDHDIQNYLDGNMSPDMEERFEIELGKNRELRDSLDQYRSLYASLEYDQDIQLSPGFTSDVIKKTNIATLGKVHFNLLHMFIALFVVIVAINVSFYYVDTKQLVEDVITTPQTESVELQPFLQNLGNQLQSIEFNTPIPVLALIIFVLLFALDRWFNHIRNKKMSFSR